MTDPEAAPRRQPRAARQPRQTVGKGPVVGSAFVHTAAILLAWWTSAVPTQVPDFVAFEVELIPPPASPHPDPDPGWSQEPGPRPARRREV